VEKVKKIKYKWKCNYCEESGGDGCIIETKADKKIKVEDPTRCVFADRIVKWKKIKKI
jgi:hypothetical protein